jgi:hypothetical protein
MAYEFKVNTFGERRRAQNSDDKQMNTMDAILGVSQWVPFWPTLRPLQFYLHLSNVDVTSKWPERWERNRG